MQGGQTSDSEKSKRRYGRNRELYCEDLAWYAQASDAAFGIRSGQGAVVSRLDRNGASVGLPETDIYGDDVIGWGNCVVGAVERVRRIQAVLKNVDATHLETLTVHYGSVPSRLRDTGEGESAPIIFLNMKLAAATVFRMTEKDLNRFIWCCERGKTNEREAVRNQIVRKYQRDAEQAVREAHRAYYRAKEDLADVQAEVA